MTIYVLRLSELRKEVTFFRLFLSLKSSFLVISVFTTTNDFPIALKIQLVNTSIISLSVIHIEKIVQFTTSIISGHENESRNPRNFLNFKYFSCTVKLIWFQGFSGYLLTFEGSSVFSNICLWRGEIFQLLRCCKLIRFEFAPLWILFWRERSLKGPGLRSKEILE